ncbi:formin-2-like [Chrysemys picta bellii]|uniref:formin-2-like n=1 Tax=Chrysemys picta bellii TaxID=8478 RepID=UPI0032B10198
MSQTPLQILVLGPEASGKSTMTRRLLREGGDSWKSLEKPQKETGKSPPTQARGLDRPRAEQHQGAAPSHLQQHFKTPKYEVIVVESLEPGGLPGNPFPGSAPAGAAVLLVPAAGGQHEASRAVTCQQVLLACNLPAKQLVVCVNKMDATQPPYSRQRYREITQAVCVCLRQLGKNPATVAFLPISGLHGDNLLEPSSRMPWFRGWAGTRKRGGTMATSLQQVLDSIVLGQPQQDSDYTSGVWSEAEMRSLLSVWKGIAGRVAHGVPLAREMSLELMGAGVRRSPQQCRVKANAMMKQYFYRQIGAGRGRCPFYQELHAILGGEVTKLMYDLEHPCEDSAGSTDLDSAGSLTEEESDSGEAEDQEMFLAGLEGDPVRMSSTPVPCLEVPPTLPASPDGTTSAGLKRKDPERSGLRLPKKPRGEALQAGTQPLAPSQGSEGPGGYLDTALNWQKPILETQCPLASTPPVQPSHRQPAPPVLLLSQPARPQQVLSLHCLRAPPPWCLTEPVPHPQPPPLQLPSLPPPSLQLPSSPTHWPQAPPLQLPSLPLQPWQPPSLQLPSSPTHWPQAPPLQLPSLPLQPWQPPSLQLPSSPTHWPQAPPPRPQCAPLLPACPRQHWQAPPPQLPPQPEQCQQPLPVHPKYTRLLPVLSQPPAPLQHLPASPLQYPSPRRPCQLALSPQPRPASPPSLLDSRPLLQALCWSLATTALA